MCYNSLLSNTATREREKGERREREGTKHLPENQMSWSVDYITEDSGKQPLL